MATTIGYSDTRVNATNSSQNKDEFGKWLNSSNFQVVRATSKIQRIDNTTRQQSFATLLKQAEQDNNNPKPAELRLGQHISHINILA